SFFFFSSRRRHTRSKRDWSSDVCSSDLDYLVYFLGFVPGFAYLGELPEALVTPRLAIPRRSVLRGSVGIAGNQTGVYPFATPGRSEERRVGKEGRAQGVTWMWRKGLHRQ